MKIEKREDVVLLVPKGSVGIELGIAEGEFANRVCAKKHMSKWYGVDMYMDHHNEREMYEMLEKMKPYPEYEFIRGLFFDVLDEFEDECLDIVYADGYAHTGQEEGLTLDDWYPKVKSGGIIAGDDYHSDWPKNVNAVDTFVIKNKLILNVEHVGEPDSVWSKYPSWWVRKP